MFQNNPTETSFFVKRCAKTVFSAEWKTNRILTGFLMATGVFPIAGLIRMMTLVGFFSLQFQKITCYMISFCNECDDDSQYDGVGGGDGGDDEDDDYDKVEEMDGRSSRE